MGFFVMVLSFIIGLLLIAFGFLSKKSQRSKLVNIISIVVGIGLILFAVWLGVPK